MDAQFFWFLTCFNYIIPHLFWKSIFMHMSCLEASCSKSRNITGWAPKSICKESTYKVKQMIFRLLTGGGVIYLMFCIQYLSKVCHLHDAFLCAIAFRKPCACSHSICCWSSHRNVSSLVAMYQASIVPSFFLRQDIFRWKWIFCSDSIHSFFTLFK